MPRARPPQRWTPELPVEIQDPAPIHYEDEFDQEEYDRQLEQRRIDEQGSTDES